MRRVCACIADCSTYSRDWFVACDEHFYDCVRDSGWHRIVNLTVERLNENMLGEVIHTYNKMWIRSRGSTHTRIGVFVSRT